jgi:transcriptional antiterminator NusG
VGTKSNDGRRSVIRPTPMSIDDVRRILRIEEETAGDEGAKVEIDLNKGDHVRIKEGPFENFDGVVEEVLPNKRTVRVTVQLLGRATPVEVEVWQVTAVS